MNTKKLVNEIIYYYKYFKIIEIDNEALIVSEIARKLDNIDFIKSLLEILKSEKQLKGFISFSNRKRLAVLILELENIKAMLSIDQYLEKQNQEDKVLQMVDNKKIRGIYGKIRISRRSNKFLH